MKDKEIQTPEYMPSGPVHVTRHVQDVCGQSFKEPGTTFVRPCQRGKGHDGDHGPASDRPGPGIKKVGKR